MLLVRILLIAFLILFAAPLAVAAALHALDAETANWRTADRSSAGLLKPALVSQDAAIRVFAARTVRWKGAFATHCWIVLKPKGAAAWTRYDYTAWGEPIRINGFVPDGRWFGKIPEVVFAADGEAAERAIPKLKAAIEAYRYAENGDYRAWPGPNSNTFVAAVLAAAPELGARLPTTAVGKDFPYAGDWLSLTPSRTGVSFTLGGYGGLTLGWREGLEVNLLGAVFGVDLRRPAIHLPGLGRFGVAPLA